ncbi:hypothetical protein FRX31_010816 [Thalictrum thalictroides]|uniref:Zinc knuckle (CCHC-type) family protein n=1 Tax=Thalictrum thalictroides TaxID=46969 RepID=A0A7J6WQF5_THATH|nr:hypothetical protein FRX31_010816 [Thalictrum thalictroides]
MKTKQGKELEVSFEYAWRPLICTKCKEFGHNEWGCPKNIRSETTNTNVNARGWTHPMNKGTNQFQATNNGISSKPLTMDDQARTTGEKGRGKQKEATIG